MEVRADSLQLRITQERKVIEKMDKSIRKEYHTAMLKAFEMGFKYCNYGYDLETAKSKLIKILEGDVKNDG